MRAAVWYFRCPPRAHMVYIMPFELFNQCSNDDKDENTYSGWGPLQSSTLSGNSTRSAFQRACGSIFQRHLRMPDEIRWWVSATSVTCPSMTIRTCSSSSALIAWQWSIGFTDAPVTSWIRFLEKFTSGLFPFEAACRHHFSVESVIL